MKNGQPRSRHDHRRPLRRSEQRQLRAATGPPPSSESAAELTLLNVLHILLNHGMIIQGEPFGPHYGPVALGEPTDELFHFCRTWGARWARLVKRFAAG